MLKNFIAPIWSLSAIAAGAAGGAPTPCSEAFDRAVVGPGRGPSFSCKAVRPGSIEALICEDAGLSALDRRLSGVYAAASRKAGNGHPPRLETQQRGWLSGRNDCRKSDDQASCMHDEYRQRIAELQANHGLVEGTGPARFACDGNATNEVVVTYFATEPPTLIAARGDRVALMYAQSSASGRRYQGHYGSFREHQGEARVRWGVGAPEMHCRKRP